MITEDSVKGIIFSYQNLKEKLKREIDRLCTAENNDNAVDAIDNALNGALTAYHLLQWEAKTKDPSCKKSAHSLLKKKRNHDLNLLHDIVTKTKHASIDRGFSNEEIEVRTSAASSHQTYFDDEGDIVWKKSRKVFVKFGDQRASVILKKALELFDD